MPPRPRLCASAATTNRRCRSVSFGNIFRYFSFRAVSVICLLYQKFSLFAYRRLGLLLEDETNKRSDNKHARLYKGAHLPFEKGLEDFDFTFQPSIKKQEIMELSTLRFLDKHANILFLGQPGTGKTHLSVSLALAALGHGKTVLFSSVWDMI